MRSDCLTKLIEKHTGDVIGEYLAELREFRYRQRKGHNQRVIYMIDIQTQIGGKEHFAGCGYANCFFGSLRACESAIRAAAAAVYKNLEKNKCKPRMVTSYDSDKIAKGAIRVYYTERGCGKSAIREFRPVSLPLAPSLAEAKKAMAIEEE